MYREKIKISYDINSTMNFSLFHNAIPVINDIKIENESEKDIEEVKICITSNSSMIEPYTYTNVLIKQGEICIENSINLKINISELYKLTERMLVNLEISFYIGEELIRKEDVSLTLLAYNEWSGILIMPEMICSFIVPNHPEIARIIINANEMIEKEKLNITFNGYQSGDQNYVLKQIAVLYNTLRRENITYINPPASYEQIGQRIRLSDVVLTQRMGTCIDLSLLLASCMEAVGLYPLIIFKKGHAFVGCWLEENTFPECIEEDGSLIRKKIAHGINEIVLIEPTMLASKENLTIEDALRLGANNMNDADFQLVIDVKRSRGSGIRPLPQVYYDTAVAKENTKDEKFVLPSEIGEKVVLNYVDKIEYTRQELWERKLLDLNLRNSLLNFRVTKNSLQLLVPDINILENEMSAGKELKIMPRPNEWTEEFRDNKIFSLNNAGRGLIEVLIENEFKNKRVRTFLDEGDMARSIIQLYRSAKHSLEENGTNTLYLALGFLKWYQTDGSNVERYAPLVLMPIEIVRKIGRNGYVIRARDEEVQFNITLLEFLKQDYGIGLSGLNSLSEDERGVDLNRLFNIIRQAIMDKPRWDVV